MSRILRVAAVSGAAVLLSIGSASAATAPAEPGAAPEIPGVPVYGQQLATGIKAAGSPSVVSLHGVQRVSGGAIVYYSIGFPDGADLGAQEGAAANPSDALWQTLGGSINIYGAGDILNHCDVAVIDQVGGMMYTALPRTTPPGASADVPLCSDAPFASSVGEARVAAVAVAELPADLGVVDVSIRGILFPEVPVGDGQLQPFAEPELGVGPLVGMGWPELDEAAIAVADSTGRTRPVVQSIQDLKGEITETQSTLELSGDVLFEIDSADIDAHGKDVLDRAVEQLKEKGASGRLLVIGHTDNVGPKDYNQDLSERRARSVAEALRPRLGSSVTIETEGRGMDEPIASNDTDAGKALNRRVTLDFTTDGGQ